MGSANWVELFDFQEEALHKLKYGCILYGNVGSGKSLVSLMFYYITQGGKYPTRVRSLIDNRLPLYIITTPKKRDSLEWEKELCTFGLTRNEGVVVDSWNNIKKYTEVYEAFFIFDEQRVVGSGAWVKAFIEITKHNPRWILLSATPGDTWFDYVPVFLANGFYRNRSEFVKEHVVYKPFKTFPQVDRYINTNRLERLRNKILVDMIRPTERVISEENCIMDYDRGRYKNIMKYRFNPWKEEPIDNASEMAYCLRRCVNESPERLTKLIDILCIHPRIIVFYSHDYEREIILSLRGSERLPEGCEISEWSGHSHEEIPDSKSWIYLTQYTAGCEGWNCIKTDTIVFYSLQYSYKVFEQAKGRIDRLNSPFRQLHYYIFRSKSGIDSAIWSAILLKKDFNARRYFDRNFIDFCENSQNF